MGDADALMGVAADLYAGLPADFTPARTAAEKAARSDGDKELAAAVKSLRKPSTGAWAVNLLVRREAEQIDQVLALADSLRAAAEALDGEELRALTRQRKQLTGALTTRARQLALENGLRLSPAVAEQVEGTLSAAMLDPAAAEAVHTGLLVTTISATGLDGADFVDAVAIADALGTRAEPTAASGPALHVVPESKRLLREVAQDKLAAAEDTLSEVTRGRDRAEKALTELRGRRFGLHGDLDELQRRIAELEDQVESLDDDIEIAEQDHEDATGAVTEAGTARDSARSALDDL